MAIIAHGGRELMTRFTCGRCGAQALMPFDNDAQRGFQTCLGAQAVPHGWRPEADRLPLLCGDCNAALQCFMNNVEVNYNGDDGSQRSDV